MILSLLIISPSLTVARMGNVVWYLRTNKCFRLIIYLFISKIILGHYSFQSWRKQVEEIWSPSPEFPNATYEELFEAYVWGKLFGLGVSEIRIGSTFFINSFHCERLYMYCGLEPITGSFQGRQKRFCVTKEILSQFHQCMLCKN